MSPVAMVFVRRTGADGLGHVGWAFSNSDSIFSAGSVENPGHTLRTRPQQMGFWVNLTRDPIAPMRARAYTELKVINLAQSNPVYAWQVVAWHRHKPYDAIGCNCMDVAYDVLRAFGVPTLPVPAHHWEPNHWFNHVQGRHYRIDQDNVVVEPTTDKQALAGPVLADSGSLRTDQLRDLAPAVPAWRIANTPEWKELQADLAAAPPLAALSRVLSAAHAHSIIDRIWRLFRSVAIRQ